jgi:hypothetical protein
MKNVILAGWLLVCFSVNAMPPLPDAKNKKLRK